MPSLRSSDNRFALPLTIVEGGSGAFHGVLSEPGQGDVPSYLFTLPRRLLRVEPGTPVSPGMVVRSPAGVTFLVGAHGPSEAVAEETFNSFILFEATGRFKWQTRGKTTDAITGLPRDTGLQTQPSIWGFYEPATIEGFDRALRTNMETGRFMTNAPVQRDDMVNDMKVSRCDLSLGLRLITLG